MGSLTPEETRRHIRHKVNCRELDPLVADRMLALHDQDPTLDYRLLHIAAIHRELPDIAFHTAPQDRMLSILEHGLRVNDPVAGDHGHLAIGQPAGVYLSDLDEAMQGRFVSAAGTCDVWRIEGLHALSPQWQQDQLNPTCWVIRQPIPPRMLRLHYTFHL